MIVDRVTRSSSFRRVFQRSVAEIAGRFALAAAWCCLIGVAGLAAVASQSQEPSDEHEAEVFKTTCTKCHTPDRVLAARKTRTQWEETLDKMTKLGATATDEDFEAVLTYVLRHSGKVNVNKAAAKDLALVLGISKASSEAIVSYRQANGNFADFDTLVKVPGLDLEKLEKVKDAIAF